MIRGLIASVPTPFSGDQVSGQALADHVAWLIEEGVDGIVVADIVGEGSTLSVDEHAHVVAIAAEVASKRVPVIAATGRMGTDATITSTQRSERAGADAALVVVPFYNRPSQEGVFRHFEAIAEVVDLPILVHDARSRTGIDLRPDTVARLAELPGIIGIVDDASTPARHLQIAGATKRGFLQFCGSDHQAATSLWVDVAGCVSSLANIAPSLCVALHCACVDHEAERACTVQAALGRFQIALGEADEIAGLKWLLERYRPGFTRSMRLPLMNFPDPAKRGLLAAFEDLRLTIHQVEQLTRPSRIERSSNLGRRSSPRL